MILQLNTAFKNILFSSKNHQYFTKDGEELISVTKLISKLKPKFNSDFWSTLKAYEFSGYKTKPLFTSDGMNLKCFMANSDKIYLDQDHSHLQVTPEMVSLQWSIDSQVGTSRGTYCHNYLENLENRLLDKPELNIPKGLTTIATINYVRSIDVANKLCNQFLEDYSYLVPIAIEYKIGDLEMGVAGTLDRLYYNTRTNDLEIWDFKTDKKIASSNKYQKIRIFDIDDCEISKYSIQTSLYKYIIEKNTDLKIDACNIAHLNIKNESVDVYECTDYTKEIANIPNWRNI